VFVGGGTEDSSNPGTTDYSAEKTEFRDQQAVRFDGFCYVGVNPAVDLLSPNAMPK